MSVFTSLDQFPSWLQKMEGSEADENEARR